MTDKAKDALAAFQAGDLDRARDLAEQQLKARPDSPPLQHLVGLIECRSGRLDSGVDWLRRASQADPSNAAFRVMLVRALVDAGRPAEALALAERPSGKSPAELALWHARAEAADAVQDHEAAAEAWTAMATARPDDWRAWSNAGNALAALGRWEETAPALRRALGLNPTEQPIRRNLASALVKLGHHEESAAELRRLVEAEPGDPVLRLVLAQVLYDLERHEESLAEFDEAARLAVGAAEAASDGRGLIGMAFAKKDGDEPDLDTVKRLALLLERTNRLDALRNLLGEAEAAGISREQLAAAAAAVALRDGDPANARRLLLLESPDDDPLRWHRLMAKAADALGDPATAFAEAEAMNRAAADYDSWRRRGADYRGRLRRLATIITRDWAAELPHLEPDKRRSPAFLVGFPRSGTTLLDTFLMGHPDTAVLEEVHMLGAAESLLGGMAELPRRSVAQLRAGRDAYFAELDRHVDPDFTGLVVDKLPLNMLGLPFIRSLFPESKVIFAQRHPVDAVLSGFMQSFVMNDAMASFLDIEDGADLYDAAMDVFTRSRDALPLSTHTIIYEQLVADPGAALKPLIDFLGLEWSDALLDHQATAKRRGAILTPSYSQVVEPLNAAPSGRWRRYEQQLEPVLPVLLPWANRLGYVD